MVKKAKGHTIGTMLQPVLGEVTTIVMNMETVVNSGIINWQKGTPFRYIRNNYIFESINIFPHYLSGEGTLFEVWCVYAPESEPQYII